MSAESTSSATTTYTATATMTIAGAEEEQKRIDELLAAYFSEHFRTSEQVTYGKEKLVKHLKQLCISAKQGQIGAINKVIKIALQHTEFGMHSLLRDFGISLSGGTKIGIIKSKNAWLGFSKTVGYTIDLYLRWNPKEIHELTIEQVKRIVDVASKCLDEQNDNLLMTIHKSNILNETDEKEEKSNCIIS